MTQGLTTPPKFYHNFAVEFYDTDGQLHPQLKAVSKNVIEIYPPDISFNDDHNNNYPHSLQFIIEDDIKNESINAILNAGKNKEVFTFKMNIYDSRKVIETITYNQCKIESVSYVNYFNYECRNNDTSEIRAYFDSKQIIGNAIQDTNAKESVAALKAFFDNLKINITTPFAEKQQSSAVKRFVRLSYKDSEVTLT